MKLIGCDRWITRFKADVTSAQLNIDYIAAIIITYILIDFFDVLKLQTLLLH